MVAHARKKKKKLDFNFYIMVLMMLLRLNCILLLRSPFRSSSWRDADFAAFLVPLWNLHKTTNSQIQSWASEHPCSQSFCAPWHCCPESEGNNSQTGSRRFSLVTDICASHYTQYKPTKKHCQCYTDGLLFKLAV